MLCYNCKGTKLMNLFELTGENISTDCIICNGTGKPVINKSNSSYGRYSIKLSESTIQYFWHKKDAINFLKSIV